MTPEEFGKIINYLESAVGRPIDASGKTAALARMEVFYDLLHDLPFEVMQTAARRVAIEHPWPTFPSVAELRAAAVETMRGQIKEMSSAEAWNMAWLAAGKIDLEIEGSVERACSQLPDLVFEAMQSFGISALACGKEPITVVRAQFTKIFDQLASRDKRVNLFPEAIKNTITSRGSAPPSILSQLNTIGVEK